MLSKLYIVFWFEIKVIIIILKKLIIDKKRLENILKSNLRKFSFILQNLIFVFNSKMFYFNFVRKNREEWKCKHN